MNKIKQYIKIIGVLLSLFYSQNISSQSLSGTTWDVSVSETTVKTYNFIFGYNGNKGNVMKPDKTLVDFSWSENKKGDWVITIEQIINGTPSIETFYGKISGNKGSGFYTTSKNKKNLYPLTMIQKEK